MSSDSRVDLMMLVDSTKSLYSRGQLDVNHYGKEMLSCAHEMFMLGRYSAGVSILEQVPASFYGRALMKFLDEDPSFARRCQEMSARLLIRGIVSLDPIPTQSASSA